MLIMMVAMMIMRMVIFFGAILYMINAVSTHITTMEIYLPLASSSEARKSSEVPTTSCSPTVPLDWLPQAEAAPPGPLLANGSGSNNRIRASQGYYIRKDQLRYPRAIGRPHPHGSWPAAVSTPSWLPVCGHTHTFLTAT